MAAAAVAAPPGGKASISRKRSRGLTLKGVLEAWNHASNVWRERVLLGIVAALDPVTTSESSAEPLLKSESPLRPLLVQVSKDALYRPEASLLVARVALQARLLYSTQQACTVCFRALRVLAEVSGGMLVQQVMLRGEAVATAVDLLKKEVILGSSETNRQCAMNFLRALAQLGGRAVKEHLTGDEVNVVSAVVITLASCIDMETYEAGCELLISLGTGNPKGIPVVRLGILSMMCYEGKPLVMGMGAQTARWLLQLEASKMNLINETSDWEELTPPESDWLGGAAMILPFALDLFFCTDSTTHEAGEEVVVFLVDFEPLRYPLFHYIAEILFMLMGPMRNLSTTAQWLLQLLPHLKRLISTRQRENDAESSSSDDSDSDSGSGSSTDSEDIERYLEQFQESRKGGSYLILQGGGSGVARKSGAQPSSGKHRDSGKHRESGKHRGSGKNRESGEGSGLGLGEQKEQKQKRRSSGSAGKRAARKASGKIVSSGTSVASNMIGNKRKLSQNSFMGSFLGSFMGSNRSMMDRLSLSDSQFKASQGGIGVRRSLFDCDWMDFKDRLPDEELMTSETKLCLMISKVVSVQQRKVLEAVETARIPQALLQAIVSSLPPPEPSAIDAWKAKAILGNRVETQSLGAKLLALKQAHTDGEITKQPVTAPLLQRTAAVRALSLLLWHCGQRASVQSTFVTEPDYTAKAASPTSLDSVVDAVIGRDCPHLSELLTRGHVDSFLGLLDTEEDSQIAIRERFIQLQQAKLGALGDNFQGWEGSAEGGGTKWLRACSSALAPFGTAAHLSGSIELGIGGGLGLQPCPDGKQSAVRAATPGTAAERVSQMAGRAALARLRAYTPRGTKVVAAPVVERKAADQHHAGAMRPGYRDVMQRIYDSAGGYTPPENPTDGGHAGALFITVFGEGHYRSSHAREAAAAKLKESQESKAQRGQQGKQPATQHASLSTQSRLSLLHTLRGTEKPVEVKMEPLTSSALGKESMADMLKSHQKESMASEEARPSSSTEKSRTPVSDAPIQSNKPTTRMVGRKRVMVMRGTPANRNKPALDFTKEIPHSLAYDAANDAGLSDMRAASERYGFPSLSTRRR